MIVEVVPVITVVVVARVVVGISVITRTSGPYAFALTDV